MKTKLTTVIVVIAGIIALLFLTKQDSFNSEKINVAASFYPLYFFASEIGGERVDAVNLTPPGAEPHDYELTAGDRVRIEKSDLVLLVGRNFEPWGKDLRDLSEKAKFLVMADEFAEIEPKRDPHFWLSIPFAKKQAELSYNKLVEVDPEGAEYYRENFSKLEKKLDDLDAKYRDSLRTCKLKDIVTSHSSFGYLAKEYGLNQVAISGISPDEEPSPQALARIANYARANNVQYIFFEKLVSPKLSETVAREIGAKTMLLNPLEGLTKEEIRDGKNFFTEMESNLNNLKIALQCQ